ncbi:hypothetical protein KI387_036903, partial [Taxus chinensis]
MDVWQQMLREGFEVHIEDMEPEQSVRPHLGKRMRETPSASNEISSHGERRTIGTHLSPPSDRTLALGFPDQGDNIASLVGYIG